MVQLCIQAGGIGIACLLVQLIGKKIDRLHDAIYQLALLVTDRNARPKNDITPPHLRRP